MKNLLTFFLLASGIPALLAAEDISLSVAVNRTEIFEGESIQIQVTVKGSDSTEPPDISAIKSCQSQYQGSQSNSRRSIIIVNGRQTVNSYLARNFYYSITPSKPGIFRVGPITLKHGGRQFKTDGPRVNVKGIEEQKDVLINLSASRDTVLVDEEFDIILSVYLKRMGGAAARYDPIDPADPPRLIAGYLDPDPEKGLESQSINEVLGKYLVQARHGPGFKINEYMARNDPLTFGSMFNMDIFRNERPLLFIFDKTTVTKDGISYFVYTLKRRYRGKIEGTFTFGNVQFKGKIGTTIDQGGNMKGKTIFAVGAAVTVRVVPPPEEGRPPSYIGAVGKNVNIHSELDTQNCTVGDPLKMKLTIGGDISMDNIYPPALGTQKELINSFRIYEDTVETETIGDKKTFTYTIRPTRSGTIELPPLDIAYFDTDKREYVTLSTKPVPVKVRDTPEIELGDIIGSTPNQISLGLEPTDPDLFVPAPIEVDPAGMQNVRLRLTGRHLAIISLSPLTFLSVVVITSAAGRSKRRKKIKRSQNALNRASGRLRNIGSKQDADAHAESCRAICGAMRGYLADRFDLSEPGITPTDAATVIRHRTGDNELAGNFSTIMENAFNSGFTGDRESSIDPNSERDAALAIMKQLHSVTNREKQNNEIS